MTKNSILTLFTLMTAALPLAAQAPVFDTSGNGKLTGNYYFRQILYGINTSEDELGVVGDIGDAIAVYGNIAFDGNGHYSITNALVNDGGNSIAQDPLSCYLGGLVTGQCSSGTAVSGTYSVSSSGYGFLLNPITGDSVYGLVAGNGMFTGSSTETASAYNDLFIASPVPNISNFSGTFNVVGYLPGEDFSFQMSPNGSGNIGTVNISGYTETAGAQSQSSNVAYRFSSNAGVLEFPSSNSAGFISGLEYIYFSPDGQFFFGGSNEGFDMIMGVTTTSNTANFGACNGGTSCLFDVAGIDQDFSNAGNGYADSDSYYSSINTTNSGSIIAHEHVSDEIFDDSVYGYVFADSFSYPAPATYTDTVTGANTYSAQTFNYWVGDGGSVRIGQSTGSYLGIQLALQAPTFTPTTPVYINPTGIVNAASFAPFTAGVSNGEFISIFGTNLAPATTVASGIPYPTTLNGVQVLIDNVPAPLYFVSSGQIAALVPYGNPYPLAQIQVVNGNEASNIVTTVVGAPGSTPTAVTTPGVYNYPPASGYAAAVDTNTGMIVTESNPANPGDTVEVFLSGLGPVYPSVADGAAAPANPPYSYTTNTVTADVDGTTATVVFAGLAPTLAGLYQVNVTIPTATTAGDHFLDFAVSNPNDTANPYNIEAYTQQVLIPVGGGAGARPEARPQRQFKPHAHPATTRKPLCTFNCSVPRS